MRWIVLYVALMVWPVYAEPRVNVVVTEWPGFTNKDLTGSYFDYLTLVLPADQFQIRVEFSSFGRALAALEKQQADLTFGLTPVDAPTLLRAQHPYDADRIVAVFRPDLLGMSSLREVSRPSLQNYRLAWDLAYNYGAAIGLTVDGYQVQNPDQGIQLVLTERVDIYLAEHGDLAKASSQKLLKDPRLRHEEFCQIPVYVGFANNSRGRALQKLWDARVRLLQSNGALAEFYRTHPDMIRSH